MRKYLNVEVVGTDVESAISHMESLIEMMKSSPDAPGWTTSDTEGSSLAEWALPGPGAIGIVEDEFHFTITHAIYMGSTDIGYASDERRGQILRRALEHWIQSEDGKAWWQECLAAEGLLAPTPKDAPVDPKFRMLCDFCRKGDVHLVGAVEPHSTEHWACPLCDSTYPIEIYPKS
jgi:hypothetical protein